MKQFHNRQSIRLRGYDYSKPGAYFITVCIHDRTQNLFGDVVGSKMVENEIAGIIRTWWQKLPVHFPNVAIDEFVIMPNHVHGIIIIRPPTVNTAIANIAGALNNYSTHGNGPFHSGNGE